MLSRSRVEKIAADITIVSPKRTRNNRRRTEQFFGYYAGFPESFSDSILQGFNLSPSTRILDPWNGSGTTTISAAKIGLRSTGADINPVMIVMARARAIADVDVGSIMPLGKQILAHARRLHSTVHKNEPLCSWFDQQTASYIRAIVETVTAFFVKTIELRGVGFRAQNFSTLACIFYVAIFSICRELTKHFRTTNPTWLKSCGDPRACLSFGKTEIFDRFEHALILMSEAFEESMLSYKYSPRFIEGDSASLNMGRSKFDFVLTSPPYCTRLDYAAATRLELAVMAPLLNIDVGDLSRKMMGSVRVPLKTISPPQYWGSECLDFLSAVRLHNSKASSSYYLKTHIDYFKKLDDSLISLCALLSKGAVVTMVVQDSYYKDVHNNLPSILCAMAANRGLFCLRRDEFRVAQSMAGRHPGARFYSKPKGAYESVMIFHKQD